MRESLVTGQTGKHKRLSLPAALVVVVIGCGSSLPGPDAGPDATAGADSGAQDSGLDAGYADAGLDAGASDGGCDCGGACPADSCFLIPQDGGDGGSCQCLV